MFTRWSLVGDSRRARDADSCTHPTDEGEAGRNHPTEPRGVQNADRGSAMMSRQSGLKILIALLALVSAACSGSTDEATATSLPPSESLTTSSVTTSTDSPTTAQSTTCTMSEFQPSDPSDWATYGFDESNSRHNRAETRISPDNVSCLEILWRIDDLGGVSGTPVVVDGVVYFGDWNGWLHAVEAETGTVVWEKQLTENAITATALVTSDRVFVPDADGFLYARDRATGSAVWTVEVDAQPAAAILAAPVFVDGKVIVGVAPDSPFPLITRGSVVAIDADTGAEAWRVKTADENSGPGVGVWSAAAVDRDRRLVFSATGNTTGPPVSPLSDSLVAIDYETGEIVWHNQLNPDDLSNLDLGASPNLFTIDGRDVVGVGGKEGWYKVLDRETGVEVWSNTLTQGGDPAGVMNTAAVGNGTIYVSSIPAGSGDSITFALNSSDGSILWKQSIRSWTFGSLTLANGVVFHGTVAGTVYALDADDGTILWSDELPGNFGDGISVAGGMLFVGHGFSYNFTPSQHGGIVAYSLP